jgi:hypothetical protein
MPVFLSRSVKNKNKNPRRVQSHGIQRRAVQLCFMPDLLMDAMCSSETSTDFPGHRLCETLKSNEKPQSGKQASGRNSNRLPPEHECKALQTGTEHYSLSLLHWPTSTSVANPTHRLPAIIGNILKQPAKSALIY